jgi:hypothetical protein
MENNKQGDPLAIADPDHRGSDSNEEFDKLMQLEENSGGFASANLLYFPEDIQAMPGPLSLHQATAAFELMA